VKTEIRIKASEARRLKNDSAFLAFVQEVRDDQIQIFTASEASQSGAREEAHAIIRALNQIEAKLNATISAETFLDRKQRK
tara:strand:+ start:148 stop:390 length:243 start_codon:yes stop_codon:yes gene_type:complete